jgi:hypothetical protein
MGFDRAAFMKAQWEERISEYPVNDPDLIGFFDKEEKPIWTVRSMTGVEIGKANEAAQKQNISDAVLEGFMSRRSKEVKDAVKGLLGTDKVVPEDIAKRIEHLMVASVEPKCDLDLALLVCKAKPLFFLQVTNEITRVTGMGMVPGKQKPSGKIPKSK